LINIRSRIDVRLSSFEKRSEGEVTKEKFRWLLIVLGCYFNKQKGLYDGRLHGGLSTAFQCQHATICNMPNDMKIIGLYLLKTCAQTESDEDIIL